MPVGHTALPLLFIRPEKFSRGLHFPISLRRMPSTAVHGARLLSSCDAGESWWHIFVSLVSRSFGRCLPGAGGAKSIRNCLHQPCFAIQVLHAALERNRGCHEFSLHCPACSCHCRHLCYTGHPSAWPSCGVRSKLGWQRGEIQTCCASPRLENGCEWCGIAGRQGSRPQFAPESSHGAGLGRGRRR